MTFTNIEEPVEATNEAIERLIQGDGQVPVEPPPDVTVTLPAGFIDMSGVLHTEAEVRELTGEDEEFLARGGNSSSLVRYFRTLLSRAVVHIGGSEPDFAVLQSLLLGDRTALLLGIRTATYGNEVEVSLVCPKCGEEFEVAIELDKDVPVREMKNPMQRTFEVPLRKGLAKIRFPNGADQEAAIGDVKRSVPEQNTIILSRCLVALDGSPVIGEETVRKMGLQDRSTLMNFIAAGQPGPLLGEVSVPCTGCGEKSPISLSMEDLFRL